LVNCENKKKEIAENIDYERGNGKNSELKRRRHGQETGEVLKKTVREGKKKSTQQGRKGGRVSWWPT